MSGPKSQQTTTERTSTLANRTTKRNTLEKITQLEQRIVSLQRERCGQLYSRRHEFRKVFCSLEETELKLNQSRKTEKKELSQQISRIKGNVQGFQKMLTDMKPGPVFMERLRQVLEETESAILAFKDKQRDVYEDLLVEERQASQEVIAFHRRMEAWLTSGSTTEHVPVAASAAERGRGKEDDTAMPPAILAFERFLQQTGGTRGGWDEYDHNTFQQVKAKHSSEDGFIEAALCELPTRTESEIRAHSAWHTEYCTLLEAKRLAIQQWRKDRELLRSQQLKTTAAQETVNDAKKKRLAAVAKRQEQERQLEQEKLQAWKRQQGIQRRDAEQQRLREEEKMAERREKEQMRQVRQYQEERERERQQTKQVEQRRLAEEREQQLMATREIVKFRERDMRAVAERKERAREKEVDKIKQIKRLDKLKEQVEVSVGRDPERLLRLTAGWQERRKAREEGNQDRASIGMNAREIPRKAVPAWRQGL